MIRWTPVLRYALLPALAVGVLTVLLLALAQHLLVDELTRTALLRSQHRAHLLAVQIDTSLRAAQREVRQLARSPLMQPQPEGEDRARQRTELEAVQGESGTPVWLGLVALDGTVLVATRGWLEGQSIATRPVFQQSLRGPFVGDVHPAVALADLMAGSGQARQELLDIGEPVRDAQGRVVAVLAAHLGVDWVNRLRAKATGEDEGRAVPAISVHVLSGAAGRPVLPDGPLPAGLPARLDQASVLQAADGQRYFAASSSLGHDSRPALLPWTVLVLQERAAALAPAQRVMRSMALLGGAAALLVAVLGVLVARRVLRPWGPVFDAVLARAGGEADARQLAEGVEAAVQDLAQHGRAPTGAEALLARLARGARELRGVVDHLPLGVAIIDRHFRVQYLNPAYTRLLGWTTEQVRGRLAAEFLFDPGERADFVRLYDQLGDRPGEVAARFDALRPDGHRVAVQWQLVPIFGEGGQLEAAIAVVQDIRPERAARARADAMAGRLQALADAAVDEALATLDADGRVLEWSRGAERLSGHPSAQALGRPLDELLGPCPELASWLLSARRDGRCAIAGAFAVADGRQRWFEGSLYALGLAPGSARFGLLLRDLSEQRAVGHALERSEARLRLALQAAELGTWDIELTSDGPRVTWSEGYADTFGLAETAMPRTMDQMDALICDADRDRLRRALRETVARDAPLNVEFRFHHPDGLRWHAIVGRALRGPDGRTQRLVGVGMDIDARKQSEQALHEGRERLERIVHTMAEGLVMVDASGFYTLANPAAAEILGLPVAQIVGLRFDAVPWRRFPLDGGDDDRYPLQRLTDGAPEVRDLRVRIVRADGQQRVISLNAQALRQADGSLAAMVSTFVDITERHRFEQALADSEARHAAVVAGASDAIVSTDLAGRITLFNPAAERIFGHPAATMPGRPLACLLPAAAQPGHAAQMAGFAASGVTRRTMAAGHVQGRHADGRLLDLEASISQATVAGQTVLTAILRDVTERVAQHRALEATRGELAQLSRRLLEQEKHTTRRLAQALHDELGQTLTALRLHWEAMQGAEAGRLPRLGERVGQLIATANRQIRGVLGDLRPPLLDEFGLAAALDNEQQQQRPPEGPPSLRLQVPPHLAQRRWPADVEYAAFMIGREALANALHHAQAQQVVLSLEGDEGELLLSVRDDGIGIAADDGRARPGHLGLVGMRERALAIGGRLQISSAPGRGTIVSLHWTPVDEPDLPGR